MDRPKIVLAAIKKHHFWVLCGVVIAVGLALWFTSTSSLDSERQTRAAKITGDLNQMVQIVGIKPHPNQKVIDYYNAQTAEKKKEVLAAWTRLYNDQKKNNTLPTALGDDFKKEFEALGPLEDLEYEYLQRYREFIGRHIPKLFVMADILRPAPVEEETPDPDAPGVPQPPKGPAGAYRPDLSGRGSMNYDGPTGPGQVYPTDVTGEGGQYGPKMIGVVYWDPTDLAAFEKRFNWPTQPTTRDVVVAQENLWVYEALLRIIKETNGRVRNRDDAAIKEIRALQIGGAAAAVLQGPESGAYAAGGGGAGATATSYDGATPPTSPPPSMAPAGPVGAGPYAPPIQSRYVDETGQRLDVDETGQPIYKDAQGQILGPGPYKLMPIRMLLLMDQTKLAKLLVECVNSNMPVEPRSVSMGIDKGPMLNMGFPTPIGPSSGRSDYGPGVGVAYDGVRSSQFGGAYSGHGRGSYGSSGLFGAPRASGATGAVQKRTLDVPVEIRGTICIYNPPDEEKLGTLAAAGSPATPPPATPPAPPPAEPPPAPAKPPPAAAAPSGGAPGVAAPAGGQPPTTGQE